MRFTIMFCERKFPEARYIPDKTFETFLEAYTRLKEIDASLDQNKRPEVLDGRYIDFPGTLSYLVIETDPDPIESAIDEVFPRSKFTLDEIPF